MKMQTSQMMLQYSKKTKHLNIKTSQTMLQYSEKNKTSEHKIFYTGSIGFQLLIVFLLKCFPFINN